jgi:preprotein translocase subunit SecD
MARQQGWFALILALAIAAGAVLASFPLQLGLDLKGGSQLTLQVLPAGSITKVKAEQLEAVKDVLDRRINGLGVAESTLQTVGDDQLVLQLPGEQDPSRAAKVLGTTALLEFRAQKPGTEQQMTGLLKLKRQAQAVLNQRRQRSQALADGQPSNWRSRCGALGWRCPRGAAKPISWSCCWLRSTAASWSSMSRPSSPARTSPPPAASNSRAATAGM